MLSDFLKKTTKFVLFLSPILLTACNGGGGGSSDNSTVNTGNLVVTSANSANNTNVVLGGTHQYTVSLANTENFDGSVNVTITSSNDQVAMLQSNSCSTTAVTATQSCSFYVKGISNGNATITASATNYQSAAESLTVSQQWGTFSSQVTNGNQLTVSQITFGGDYVYAYADGAVVQSNGGEWQVVGGGNVITADFSYTPAMASDATHVCVGLGFNGSGLATEVKCSSNGGTWQTSATLNDWQIYNMSLYQNNIYILAYSFGSISAVFSCPVDNCTNWQQQGQTFSTIGATGGGNAIFESTPFIQNNTGTYYKSGDGTWQLYGNYATNNGNYMAVDSTGVAMMPVEFSSATPLPYTQQVYYNGSNNIGGSFDSVSSGIEINSFTGYARDLLAINGNAIFASPATDDIYMSTNVANAWLPWAKVGDNNPSLSGVYVNNNIVYSIHYFDNSFGSQIYVYSLD